MSDPDPDAGFPDRGPEVFIVTTLTLSLATLLLTARMFSRVSILRQARPDDYVMVLAWLIAVFLSLSIILGVTYGLGRHYINIDPQNRAALRMSEYVFSILYVRMPLQPGVVQRITNTRAEPGVDGDQDVDSYLLPPTV